MVEKFNVEEKFGPHASLEELVSALERRLNDTVFERTKAKRNANTSTLSTKRNMSTLSSAGDYTDGPEVSRMKLKDRLPPGMR